MNKHYLYIANWKMARTFSETTKFVIAHLDDFTTLADNKDATLVLAPSLENLSTVHTITKNTKIQLSAQTCSSHSRGSFTGQTSALSLKELGCSWCIVGHSERRKYNGEDDDTIAQQCIQLFDAHINPIVCIGENLQEYKGNRTFDALEQQLAPLWGALKGTMHEQAHLYIAYEPIWAVGAGQAADNDHLETVLVWIKTQTEKKGLLDKISLIYGGSISSENISRLKELPLLDGFLIGRASLGFQELEKIVHYK